MRNFVLAWIVLLVVGIFAHQALDLDIVRIVAGFPTLPLQQQFVVGAAALVLLWLTASALWQAQRLSRQDKDLKRLHRRLDSFRDVAIAANEAQNEVDAAVRHVVSSDPVELMTSLQKRISEAENRTTHQTSRNASIDMNERLDEVRRRQQSIRSQLGEMIEKRRVVEPIFGELRERQSELERSLAEMENLDGFATRLKQLGEFVVQTDARMRALQEIAGDLELVSTATGRIQSHSRSLAGCGWRP